MQQERAAALAAAQRTASRVATTPDFSKFVLHAVVDVKDHESLATDELRMYIGKRVR